MSLPIVFVHLGGAPPLYLRDAVKQARRWNPVAPIFCLSSVVEDYGHGETWVDISNIPAGPMHLRFKETTLLPGMEYDKGFWQWTTERLFVLEDWMRWTGAEECFHLENDNMLYHEISAIQPFLKKISPGLSTTFQGQGGKRDSLRTCFSVLYCSSVDALTNFLFYLASSPSSVNEMERSGLYWLDTPEECVYLATAPVGSALDSETYRSWFEDERFREIGAVFDSSIHGQYLGGIDPIHTNVKPGPGYVTPESELRADQFIYTWGVDEEGRRYPVLADKDGRPWKIMNLHMHCKRLADFA
jgi:hypothetical protein